MALIGDPELLFLDEPTTGFDPSARRQAWEVIAGLRELGKTVFLTTHYMDEAQRLADRVAIIAARRDRRPRHARRTSATARASRRRISFRLPPGSKAGRPARASTATQPTAGARSSTTTPVRTLNELTGWALERGVELEGLEVTPAQPRGRLPAS